MVEINDSLRVQFRSIPVRLSVVQLRHSFESVPLFLQLFLQLSECIKNIDIQFRQSKDKSISTPGRDTPASFMQVDTSVKLFARRHL